MDLAEFVTFFQNNGYWAVFGILIVCGFGVPIPEDIPLVAGGVISGLGYTDVYTMTAIGLAGVLLGDASLFAIGRLWGEKVIKIRWIARFVTPKRYAMVQRSFEKYGQWVLFMARFMPGLRSSVFLIAGTTRRVSFLRFLCTDGTAALISVPVWIFLGYFGASNLDVLKGWVVNAQFGFLALLGVGLILVVLLVIYEKRKRRRAQEKEDLTKPGSLRSSN